MKRILELRILPPFAIARLGSSPSPMDSYKATVEGKKRVEDKADPDSDPRSEEALPFGARRLDWAKSFVVNLDTGDISLTPKPDALRFRTGKQVRPVAPFFELWARVEEGGRFIRLTSQMLAECGLSPGDVTWHVHVANHKAYRRTGDLHDRIEAKAGPISDHVVHRLDGICDNFRPGKTLPLGSVQYIKPNAELDEIRFRFTPAAGKVYGPQSGNGVADNIYDDTRGSWPGWHDQDNDVRVTIPDNIYAWDPKTSTDTSRISLGYLDDECDGIIEVELGQKDAAALSAFARIAVGPPTFAPDSFPIRTVHDELLQALLGPDARPGEPDAGEAAAHETLRRALETVRLMNTEVQNRPGVQRGVGMARMDQIDVQRAEEPIMNPSVVDSLAVRTRHERLLLALESGTLAWFSRVLRRYDEVGDLSDEGRRKMPALMRGADGRYLALTRRKVSIMELQGSPAAAGAEGPGVTLDPELVELVSQLEYEAEGNPPSAHPSSAISNSYPGLEMDFRNIWKKLFVGIELHESSNVVVAVDGDAPPEVRDLVNNYVLQTVNGRRVYATVTGPSFKGGPSGPLQDTIYGDDGTAKSATMALEWSNALADVVQLAGREIKCGFRKFNDRGVESVPQRFVNLRVRSFYAEHPTEAGGVVRQPVIARDIAVPGQLSQSLCSPWQNDYRECSCFYWAASRPDFVNVEARPDGTSAGHNWMQKNRTPHTPKVYVIDDWIDSRTYTHDDLFARWEELRFIFGGRDET